MKPRAHNYRLLFIEAAVILLALLYLIPFYFVGANSFKSLGEIILNAASWPKVMRWENYKRAWDILQLGMRFNVTLIITVCGNTGLIIISSMAAYRLTRRPTRMNNVLFSIFIAAMVIPFYAVMIPLVKVASWFHLSNSIPGIILCYLGFGVSMTMFLYRGFIRSIPVSIEESAVMDGCGPYSLFWRIVFPLLAPMNVTVIVLNTFWMWNDFLLANIMLQRKELRTIQIAINSLFAEYIKEWDLALAALVMSVLPLLIFFLFLQRYIIEGIIQGAIKG